MDAADLCYAGAATQARMVANGEVSAVEVTQACLDRIERVDPSINAYRVVRAEQALAEAATVDVLGRSHDMPLRGVPIGIKDNLDVAGEVTTLGSNAFETPAQVDAPLVQALRDAGAVIIGKTTCSELTVWPFTENETWGATRNPWNGDFSAGGSSGGSGAAVAAGLCGVAVGSDGLGSIRVPAGFNGVIGLKPQRSRVWHGGGGWNGLSVNGPLARHVADAALFLDAVGEDLPTGGFSAAMRARADNLRVALCWKPMVDYPMVAKLGAAERRAVATIAEALRSVGHSVVEHELDFSRKGPSNGMVRYLDGVGDDFQSVEFSERITRRTATMAKIGRRLPEWLVAKVRRDEAEIAVRLNRVFDDFDVVLTPGAVERPLRIGELDGKGAMTTLRRSGKRIPHYGIWNVVGQPAISIPAGFSDAGLPLSAQVAGRADDELTLLQIAAQLETVVPWADRRPDLNDVAGQR